jgi:hypothetical protein
MGEPELTRAQLAAVSVVALLCLLLPFGSGYSIHAGSLYVGNFAESAAFYVLALIPGAAAVLNHALSRVSKHAQSAVEARRFRAIRDRISPPAPLTSTGTGGSAPLDERASALALIARAIVGALASALVLTSVFLLVAVIADKYGFDPKNPGLKGLLAAGLGAYVSVVYFMIGRMYANALSSRFVSASALRAAFSCAIGLACGALALTDVLPAGKTPWAALFLVGLFQNAAYTAIRSRADGWFGAAKAENEELPLDTIQGVDDTSVDLLREYGVATIQQVADSDAEELSNRTLIPLRTLADWIDQALLIRELQRKIAASRLLGIRTASDVANVFLRSASGDLSAIALLKTFGQKTELGDPGTDQLARKLVSNATVRVVYEYVNGTALGTFLVLPPEFEKSFEAQMAQWKIVDPAGTAAPNFSLVRMKPAAAP